jgi:L-lactate permease
MLKRLERRSLPALFGALIFVRLMMVGGEDSPVIQVDISKQIGFDRILLLALQSVG